VIFGRVEAIAMPCELGDAADCVHITVYLESGRALRTIREIEVAALRPIDGPDDLAWHADQYAQETIGSELALDGWEVIAGGDVPLVEDSAVARSASYVVRRLAVAESE
jgi:hypothetical protein